MPVINVEMLAGKTREQKKALVRELTDGFVRAVGGEPDGIYVYLYESEKENMGVGGVYGIDKYPD